MERIKELLDLDDEKCYVLRDEPQMVVGAGAGSGKTRSLVAKYLSILESGNATVEQIVAITFTKNGASELKARIQEYIEKYIDRYGEHKNINLTSLRKLGASPIGTIHSFCSSILRENALEVGISPNFSVVDEMEGEEFYLKCIRNILINDLSKSDNLIVELLRLEGYDVNRVVETLRLILKKASLLHLEPPFSSFGGGDDFEKDSEREDFLDNFYNSLQVFLENVENLVRYEELFKRTKKESERKKRFDFCYARLKRFCRDFDKKDIPISESIRLISRIKEIIGKINKKSDCYEKVSDLIYRLEKNSSRLMDNYSNYLTSLYLKVAEDVYNEIKDIKINSGIIDHEDQIRLTYDLLDKNKDILSRYRDRYRYFIVDEFQDTDKLQFNIITLLSEGKNLVVVGDVLQSIYMFRGGDPEIMEGVLNNKDFFQVSLSNNYRSTPFLIDHFNEFFEKVFESKYLRMKSPQDLLKSSSEKSDVVKTIISIADTLSEARIEEAEAVASYVSSILETDEFKRIALLFRKTTNTAVYEASLRKRGISFISDFGKDFFKRHEVRDVISLLRYIVNPNNKISELAILRSPFLGASDKDILAYVKGEAKDLDTQQERIKNFLTLIKDKRNALLLNGPLYAVGFMLDHIGYSAVQLGMEDGESKFLNTRRLYSICEILVGRGYGFEEIIDYFDKAFEKGSEVSPSVLEKDDSKPCVYLTTVHKSKGLEFDVVILCDTNYGRNRGGFESRVMGDASRGFLVGISPLGKSSKENEFKEYIKEKEDLDEKRLLYVAKTRAKKELVVFIATSLNRSKGVRKYEKGSFAHIIDDVWGSISSEKDTLNEVTDITSNPEKKDISQQTIQRIRCSTQSVYSSGETLSISNSPVSVSSSICIDRYSVEMGSIFHRFLQLWDWEKSSIDTVLDFVLREFCFFHDDVKRKVEDMASRFLDSSLFQKIKSAKKVFREYPFVVEIENEIRRGRIDLLLELSDGVEIYDYKYRKSKYVSEFYDQLNLYSKAVEKKYGFSVNGSFLVFLPEIQIREVSRYHK